MALRRNTLVSLGLPTTWWHGTVADFPRLSSSKNVLGVIWLGDFDTAKEYADKHYIKDEKRKWMIKVELSPDLRVLDLTDPDEPFIDEMIGLMNEAARGRGFVGDRSRGEWLANKFQYGVLETYPFIVSLLKKRGVGAILLSDVAGWGGHEETQSLALLSKKGIVSEQRYRLADVVDAMKKNPDVTFREDIPNARWVADKLEEAEDGGRNRWGVPRRMGPVTGSFSRSLRLPTDLLAPLRGERGEQDDPRIASLQYIADHWERLQHEAVYIEVDPFGQPWVSEGNHRIMVARTIGVPTVLAEVRYFSGGQKKAPRSWKPKRLLELDASAQRERMTPNKMESVDVRKNPSHSQEDIDDALERLDEMIGRLDFSLVQEGEDLSFRKRRAMGYHYTSERNFQAIAREGLGGKVGFEPHEFAFWLAMPYVAPDDAASILLDAEEDRRRAYSRGEPSQKTLDKLQALLDEVPDLHVAWFYREPGMAGVTAGRRERCVRFNLHEVGEWLSQNAESVNQFTDNADGYAVAWIGPKIPPEFLEDCGDDF